MKLFLVSFVLIATLTATFGQSRYEPFAEKPGSCPPALPVQICTRSCFYDSHCVGIGKCCPTSCGGFVCSRPVTMRPPIQREKPGACPAVPTGRWVCSPTCSGDSDCRGGLKCCKNRCGALVCQKPDFGAIESVEIPVVPLPGNPYNVPRNPYDTPRNPYDVPRNPYDTPRNPYNYPYYAYNN